ncbi:MAG: DsbA family protein [Candidatus Woesearchaeota archaeon]
MGTLLEKNKDVLALVIAGVLVIGIITLSIVISVDSPVIEEALARVQTNHSDVVVTAFIDYDCPACAETFDLLRQLAYDYPEIVVEIKQFPISSGGFEKAVVAECARDEGRFTKVSEKLFDGEEIDINTSDCGEERVKRHMIEGDERLVSGTPTLFINGVEMQGLKDYSIIKQEVKHAIRDSGNN